MLILDKSNICEYLAMHYPDFSQKGEVTIQVVGGLDEELCEDQSQGFINHVYRVSNGETSLIVKQGRTSIRFDATLSLPSSRNLRECDSMRMRQAMVPQYVPAPYFQDRENAVFLMEDVSYLGSVRYQLCKNVKLPKLASQVAEYVAVNAFYTSEFYLPVEDFRKLDKLFVNTEMRRIMEDWVFLRSTSGANEDGTDKLDAMGRNLANMIDNDPEVSARVLALRHKYMTNAEALVHGDLHISNMFANQDSCKIIDMEYTFAGPLCYDIGYFLNSLLGQYCSAVYRDFPSEAARTEYLQYLITSCCTVFNAFVDFFCKYWEKDAKPEYRYQRKYRDIVTSSFLGDVLGFSAIPSLGQVHYTLMPEFTTLPEVTRHQAQGLMTNVSLHFLRKGDSFGSMEEAMADLLLLSDTYRQNVHC